MCVHRLGEAERRPGAGALPGGDLPLRHHLPGLSHAHAARQAGRGLRLREAAAPSHLAQPGLHGAAAAVRDRRAVQGVKLRGQNRKEALAATSLPRLFVAEHFSGLHDSSAHYLLWVKPIWCVTCAQHFATWTVKKQKTTAQCSRSEANHLTFCTRGESCLLCFFCICFDLRVWSLARAVSVSISCLLSSNHCDIFLQQQHCAG